LESTQFVLEKKQAQKKETTTSIAQLESQLASTKAMRSKYVAALETMSTMGNSMNNDLSAVVDNMVTDLEVNSIGHSGERVDLSGKADSEQEIFKYVRILQDTGRFEEITISNITRDGASENATMRYTLALRLEGE
jgi:Tfp pilus assembly protein PilN